MTNPVTQIPAANSEQALAHFQTMFSFETDCWDTHFALQQAEPGFVLLDVRNEALFRQGHIKGAVHLPYGKIVEGKMQQWPQETLFVVYCAGPHCNGAAKAAVRLAQIGRSVKLMAGGITGWLDEGFELEAG
ncbi:rhodanese-like domain-containing protein [Thalassotalea montiporae]